MALSRRLDAKSDQRRRREAVQLATSNGTSGATTVGSSGGSSGSSSKTPPFTVNKQILSFEELDAKAILRSPRPRTFVTATKSGISSHLTLRIRQQILKNGDEISPPPASSSADKRRKEVDRRMRFVQQRLVEVRQTTSSPTNTTTPVNSSSGGSTTTNALASSAAFFTPSPTNHATPNIPSTQKDRAGTRASIASTRFDAPGKTPPLPPAATCRSSGGAVVARSTSLSASRKAFPSRTTSSPVLCTAQIYATTTRGTKTSGTKVTNAVPVRKARSPLSTQSGTGRNASRHDDDEEPSTRRNMDKRTARLRYGGDFSAEIDRYRNQLDSPIVTPKNSTRRDVVDDTLKVYVRKRPMFSQQLENGDFDVVQILDGDPATADGTSAVIVYRTVVGADMRTKMVQPVVFSQCITAAFDHTIGSAQVYRSVLRPLVETVIHENRAATLLLFGQTGSGKTYTMTACQKLLASELFATVKQVQVQCLELVGKRCRDLLVCKTGAAVDVRIVDMADGSVAFANAAMSMAESPRELLSTLVESQKRRATQSTEKNDVSSRSHAIFQIRTLDGSGRAGRGVLTLIDCAGTERRNDSLFHGKERQAESAEINTSLYALKVCIRARLLNASAHSASRRVRVPYRSSNLTRVLRESLECSEARLSVIATIAPNATDTEHTIQTLTTLSNLTGADCQEGELQKLSSPTVADTQLKVPPKKWSHADLIAWLSENQLSGKSPVSRQLDGSAVMRMSKIQLRNAFYDDAVDHADRAVAVTQAEVLFQSLRAESDRVASLDLKRRMAATLKSS